MKERTKQKKSKKDRGLLAAISIAVLLLAIGLIPIISSGVLSQRYQEFVSHYTDSMVISRKLGNVEAVINGIRQPVSVDKAGEIYNLILNAGMGKPQTQIPEDDAIEIIYSDRAAMQFWKVPIKEKNAKRETGLFVRYQTTDGYTYQYDTDELTLDSVINKLQ